MASDWESMSRGEKRAARAAKHARRQSEMNRVPSTNDSVTPKSTLTLFCPWVGRLPEYARSFHGRIEQCNGVRLILIADDRPEWCSPELYVSTADMLRRLSSLGVDVRDESLRIAPFQKVCDLRPLLADAFSDLATTSHWGWCDVDIVLPGIAFMDDKPEEFFAPSVCSNGPLSILKNTEEMRRVYKFHPEWKRIAESPSYNNFDEIGMTGAVMSSGCRYSFANEMQRHSGMDQRTADSPNIVLLNDGTMLDLVRPSRLALFHFPHWNSWPNVKRSGLSWHPPERHTSAPWLILPWLFNHRRPKSVVDFGCNSGCWLNVLRQLQVEFVGIDGDNMRPHVECQNNFRAGDLSQPIDVGRYDLAICLEVAEHVPESGAATLVDNVTRASDWVLWSAAVPGQGGYAHINCQPEEYWEDLFRSRGFAPSIRVREAVATWPIPAWYKANIKEFHRC